MSPFPFLIEKCIFDVVKYLLTWGCAIILECQNPVIQTDDLSSSITRRIMLASSLNDQFNWTVYFWCHESAFLIIFCWISVIFAPSGDLFLFHRPYCFRHLTSHVIWAWPSFQFFKAQKIVPIRCFCSRIGMRELEL